MARSTSSRLNLWMNGLPVGYWDTTRGGERLTYLDAWLDDPQGRPLSLSLPFTPGNQPYRGQLVADYFDNLLPDSEPIRRRIAARFRIGSTAPFPLLSALGRDCVGALQMLPPDEAPADLTSIRGRELSDAEIGALLRGTTSSAPLGQHDPLEDLRLSIAGAQEKTALLRHRERWLLPEGSTPTTHIFKLPLGLVGNMRADMRTSVENEWLCSQIVAAYGLPVARCEIAQFDEQKVLIVERFDRRLSRDASWIVRLPQEDMCQATGRSALHKYESDGGPGIETIMAILAGSARTETDRRNFFAAQLVFWLLAATDGHAKNFSIAHLPGNRYEATPLYDVLSAHPIIGSGAGRLAPQKVKLAMAVRGRNVHYLLNQIQRRHWIAEGQRAGFSAAAVDALIDELSSQTEAVIEQVASRLPGDFPMDVADAVFGGMRRLNEKLAR
ncbi:type II toxin-antitoxin system HipA family toxin [Paraburkholderia sp. MMS20-SJTR3]|uniref:Type II toxin-antitoxin system HipA family toxin n=1 Tax=Paraburkholderia sejongensis TaxID=2886946 RepID=A0ABS8K0G8_9BURK|nr:type II toxin-antitoxin system HipA family toxin [Paraburkholderia sp. MMS20-SJTR3]MCC8395645.1 type II toxin-antitoxin system HipA family toxin [Paraburkholderia sp. MMS20-SJTR3]